MTDVFLPSWQVLLAIAGAVFLAQHKWTWLHPFIGADMVECAFCLGGRFGWLAWVWGLGVTDYPPPVTQAEWFSLAVSLVVWVLGAAEASLALDKMTGGDSVAGA